MSTYARLGHSLSDSLIPAQTEDRRRTATALIQASTQFDSPRRHSEKPLVRRVPTPNQVVNETSLTPFWGSVGARLGSKMLPSFSSCKRSN